MKKLIFLCAILISSWASADIQMQLGDLQSPQYTATIVTDLLDPEMGRKVLLKNPVTGETSSFVTEYSISQILKINLTPLNSAKLKAPLELLLVVLANGHFENIEIYQPIAIGGEEFIPQIKALKSVTNYESLYWDQFSDVKPRIHLSANQSTGAVQLSVDIATLQNDADPLSFQREPVVFFTLP